MSPEKDTTSEVSDKLNALHTALLGIPGTDEKGFIGDVKSFLGKLDKKIDDLEDRHDERILATEKYIAEQRGAGKVIHYGITVVVSAISGFAARYLK